MMIGQLSQESGFGVETIRYYEKEGLLAPKKKPGSGYRVFELADVQRLAFIRRAKELGFSLKETRELLELSIASKGKCGPIKKRAQAKLSDVQAKIVDLTRINDSLASLIASCDENAVSSECPILEDFYMDGRKR